MKLKVKKFMDPTKRQAKFGATVTAEELTDRETSPITDRLGRRYLTFSVYERSQEALRERVNEVVARAKLNLARARQAGTMSSGQINGEDELSV